MTDAKVNDKTIDKKETEILNLIDDKGRFLYRTFQKSILFREPPERIQIPLIDKMLWENGGYSNNKDTKRMYGYATCISDESGSPKTVTSVKRNPFANGKHALIKTSNGDMVCFGFFSVTSNDIGIRSFVAVYQIVRTAQKFAVLDKRFVKKSFIISDDEVSKNMRNLINATITKMKTQDCLDPIFINRWGVFGPRAEDQYHLPELKTSLFEDFDTSKMKIFNSLKDLENALTCIKSDKLKVFPQIFRFTNDGMAIATIAIPFTIEDMKKDVLEISENSLVYCIKISKDFPINFVNAKFLFGAKSVAEFKEISNFFPNKVKQIDDRNVLTFRTFK